MSHALRSILFIFCLILAQNASALLEFNVGYHGLATNSSGGNWLVPGAAMSGAYGLQADVRFEVPITGLGVGVRYGKLGLDVGSGGQSATMNSESIAALAAYRFINTGFLLGGVFTYGLSNSGSLKNTQASSLNNTVTAGSVSNYTLGLELGIKLPILLAVEAGYGSLQMSGFGSQTLSGRATSVDISGLYVRGSVGFSF